jgi:hypothetical protein
MMFLFNMNFSKPRKFIVEIEVEIKDKTVQEGIQEVKKMFKELCLKVRDVKPAMSNRTEAQNRALHLWMTMLSDEMLSHGLDMKAVLKKDFEFSPTPFAIKEYIWRPTQQAMFGKKSTTKLDKLEEINQIVEVITKALSERTNGVMIVPSFPSEEALMNN